MRRGDEETGRGNRVQTGTDSGYEPGIRGRGGRRAEVRGRFGESGCLLLPLDRVLERENCKIEFDARFGSSGLTCLIGLAGDSCRRRCGRRGRGTRSGGVRRRRLGRRRNLWGSGRGHWRGLVDGCLLVIGGWVPGSEQPATIIHAKGAGGFDDA